MAKRRVHRVPHEKVKGVLAQHGIVSVNQAVEWGETMGERLIICERCVALGDMLDRKMGVQAAAKVFPAHCHWCNPECRTRKFPLISAKSIEGIVRGKRVLGVEFDRVDQILCALETPEHWYLELSRWYYPPGYVPDPEFETFLAQASAFERACEMLEGVDSGLVFG